MKKNRVLVKENTSDQAPWNRGELESLMDQAFDDLVFVEGECESRVRFDFKDSSSVWFNSQDVEGTLYKKRRNKIVQIAKRYKLKSEVHFV